MSGAFLVVAVIVGIGLLPLRAEVESVAFVVGVVVVVIEYPGILVLISNRNT